MGRKDKTSEGSEDGLIRCEEGTDHRGEAVSTLEEGREESKAFLLSLSGPEQEGFLRFTIG